MRKNSKAAKKGDDIAKQFAAMQEKMAVEISKMIAQKMAMMKEEEMKNDKLAFIDKLNSEEVNKLLVALLPVLQLETGGKYMIGTAKHTVQIKSDRLFIRVGGGFATLEDYLKQNGPFECIKIAKVMRDKNCSYKDAVAVYLDKHKASKAVVKEWLKGDDSNSELFERTIQRMRDL